MSNFLKQQRAVVVFSGGQDSVTCLGWALRTFKDVVAVSFNYNQKHSVELKQAKKITKKLNVEHHILDVSLLNQLTPNALTRNNIDVCHHSEVEEEKEPITVVRGRNGLFGWLASVFASTHKIENVVLGCGQADSSGYIDCRDTFIKSLQVAVNLGIDDNITIHTPLMFLDKCETNKLAYDANVLDIVIKDSHTCYNGDRSSLLGCNTCPACYLRNKGFREFSEKYNIDMEEEYGLKL